MNQIKVPVKSNSTYILVVAHQRLRLVMVWRSSPSQG